jgi:hypothetical protein
MFSKFVEPARPLVQPLLNFYGRKSHTSYSRINKWPNLFTFLAF